jgi:hypothetical protein
VDAGTGAVQPVARFPEGTIDPGACGEMPDRRALVCSLAERKSDVWIVDHFDPQAAPAKK